MEAYPKIAGVIEKGVLFHRKDGDVFCVGTRQTDRYVTASEQEVEVIYKTLQLVDGSRSVDELQRISDQRRGFSKVSVQKLLDICKKAGLTESEDDKSSSCIHDELDLMLVNLKSFGLSKLYSLFGIVASMLPFIAAAMLTVAAVASYQLLSSGESIPLNALLNDPRVILYAWVIQIPSIIVHEMSHAVVAYRYGIRPKTLSFCVFYYCSLAFYVRIPGIYFKPERQRVAIWGAGVFVNMFLAAVFVIVYLATGEQLHLFASVGVIVNLGLALSNMLPFFYSDGYYILSTLLKTPNLRKKTLFSLKSLIKGKITKDTLVYWLYLLVTVGVVASVIGIQVVTVGSTIFGDVLAGASMIDLATKYSNILLIAGIAVVARIISRLQKGRRDHADEATERASAS